MSFAAYLIALVLFIFLGFGFDPIDHQEAWAFGFFVLGHILGGGIPAWGRRG